MGDSGDESLCSQSDQLWAPLGLPEAECETLNISPIPQIFPTRKQLAGYSFLHIQYLSLRGTVRRITAVSIAFSEVRLVPGGIQIPWVDHGITRNMAPSIFMYTHIHYVYIYVYNRIYIHMYVCICIIYIYMYKTTIIYLYSYVGLIHHLRTTPKKIGTCNGMNWARLPARASSWVVHIQQHHMCRAELFNGDQHLGSLEMATDGENDDKLIGLLWVQIWDTPIWWLFINAESWKKAIRFDKIKPFRLMQASLI